MAVKKRGYRRVLLAGLTLLVAILCHGALPAQPVAPSGASAPLARPHPLPLTLANWQDPQRQGDYFDQIKPSKAGYLVWSQFPIQVYVQPVSSTDAQQQERWQTSVAKAIQEWQLYLPIEITTTPEAADITIAGQKPADPRRGPVRSGETRYQIYVDAQQQLAHRSAIKVRPYQTTGYITAAVRHELGHALGLWGHSPAPTDVLYFAQVRNPPPISARDINTLKRIYEQPTRLGWPVEQPSAASGPGVLSALMTD